MNSELELYLEYTSKPWGMLTYKAVWKQLSHITNSKILDFGSGFGTTANHLAKNNEVLAIEPDENVLAARICENNYEQIKGDIKQLRELENNSFDVIVCHCVLEYVKERKDVFSEFCRVLKPNGVTSILKHNRVGKIMYEVVRENNIEQGMHLLNGGTVDIMNYGNANYYDVNDMIAWAGDTKISVEKVFGVRTFWDLQQKEENKFEPNWPEKMLEIENRVSTIEEFIKISYFNHVLLRKK